MSTNLKHPFGLSFNLGTLTELLVTNISFYKLGDLHELDAQVLANEKDFFSMRNTRKFFSKYLSRRKLRNFQNNRRNYSINFYSPLVLLDH